MDKFLDNSFSYHFSVAMLTWTIILADHFINESSKKKELPKFCFEFEFYNKQDTDFLLIQRFPVLYEDSEDVLDDGKCVKVSLADVHRFLDEEKVNVFAHFKFHEPISSISLFLNFCFLLKIICCLI